MSWSLCNCVATCERCPSVVSGVCTLIGVSAANGSEVYQPMVPSDPQQTPVHNVEQDERQGKCYSALLVDPYRNLLARSDQAAMQMTGRFLGYLELDSAHRFHFHRVRQLGVQLRGALKKPTGPSVQPGMN